MYVSAALVPLLAAVPSLACITGPFDTFHWLATIRNGSSPATRSVPPPTSEPLRLIRFARGDEPVPMSGAEVYELLKTGVNFFDVTDQDLELLYKRRAVKRQQDNSSFPIEPTRLSEVRSLIATIQPDNLPVLLSTLISYHTRYYNTTLGAEAAESLFSSIQRIATGAANVNGRQVSVSQFRHPWGQHSIIARIAQTGTENQPVVIMGAHLDSININNPREGLAPGADDDGSGIVATAETFRTLIASNFMPGNPVEFHFYAGEEAGLLGSQAIAANYTRANITVKAYMNFDMTAWIQAGTNPQIGFVSDLTDASLNAFTKTLVTTYLSGVNATDDECGYACSDHASWNELGVPAIFPFEATTPLMNPNIHTANDTIDHPEYSFPHVHEFVKLGVAFMVELAGSDSTTSSGTPTGSGPSASGAAPSNSGSRGIDNMANGWWLSVAFAFGLFAMP